MGSIKEVTMQFVAGSYQKQVIVMNIPRTGTVVDLQSTNLNLVSTDAELQLEPGLLRRPYFKEESGGSNAPIRYHWTSWRVEPPEILTSTTSDAEPANKNTPPRITIAGPSQSTLMT